MTPVDTTTDRQENGVSSSQTGGIKRGLQSFVVKIEALASKKPLAFATLLVTGLFAAVIFAIPPAYQTNDDAIMNMVAAGQVITLEPDEHLFCTNVIIGKLLKSLYLRYPDFSWYGWYLVATQWIATIALVYCFLQPNYSRSRLFYFLLYFLTAGIYFIVNLQFTTTAMLSVLAGVMLLLLILRSPRGRGFENSCLPLWPVVFDLGRLIRNESYMLSMMLACPVFSLVYWLGEASRRTGMAVCCVLGIAFGSLFLAVGMIKRLTVSQGGNPFINTLTHIMSNSLI